MLAGAAILVLALGGCSRTGETTAAFHGTMLTDAAVAAVPEVTFPDQIY
jgi:hypothetical protein